MASEIRILARLSNGSLRRAERHPDNPMGPQWRWVYEGMSKQQLLADIIVSFPNDKLPTTAAEFAAALGFNLVQ